jgi:putative redox protein
MGEVRLQWLEGKTFVGTDSTKHGFVISTSGEENGTGIKPSDLLLIGLASCAAVDVVEILNKKRQPFDKMEIRTEGTQDDSPPWTFRKIHMHFIFHGAHLSPRAVEQAIKLSESKYCSVAATVRGVAQITTSFEILPAPSILPA